MQRSVLIAAFFLSLADGCRTSEPWNAEGFVRIACIGDSNTYWSGFGVGPAWPTYVRRGLAAAGYPNVDLQPYAMIGATALTTGREWQGASLDGEIYVRNALATRPSIAVLALGTNDVADDAPPAAIAERLLEFAARLEAEGAQTLVALVPPTRAPGATRHPQRPATVVAVNALLRARLPAHQVIDFFDVPDSDFDADTVAPIRLTTRDGGHLNTPGQQRRAQRVLDRLLDRRS